MADVLAGPTALTFRKDESPDVMVALLAAVAEVEAGLAVHVDIGFPVGVPRERQDWSRAPCGAAYERVTGFGTDVDAALRDWVTQARAKVHASGQHIWWRTWPNVERGRRGVLIYSRFAVTDEH